MTILLEIVLVVLGLILLASGADYLVDGSSKIARKFGIPEIIIGLTIISIGTSLPELVISVNAAINGENSISLGNVVGSNFANLFLVIGLCMAIKPLHIKRQTRFVDQPLVAFFTILLYIMVINDGKINRFEGGAMLMMTALYIAYNILMAKYGKSMNAYKSENEEEIEKEKNLLQRTKAIEFFNKEKSKFESKYPVLFSVLAMAIGIVLLKIGGDLTVNHASEIAYALGLSKDLIAITIVAIGTSLPELITCLQATRKGETDLAIGNIAGSQIFNIILILGASSTITPIQNVISFQGKIIILVIGNIIYAVAPFMGKRHRVGRMLGVGFFLYYLSFMAVEVFEETII